jgi:hypothetical protein
MKFVLLNGDTREVPVGGALMGFPVEQVVFTSDDVYKLLKMEDEQLRFWLSSLTHRFVPEQ